jgi:transcriptional regulator with XRE-family HTH domain
MIADAEVDCNIGIPRRPMETTHFDVDAFFAALDAQRQAKRRTWKQVAAETGVSASTLTRMAQGRKPDVDGLAALLRWSGLKAEDFVITGPKQPQRKAETLAMICSQLRADPHLKKEDAEALEAIIRVAYEKLRTT